MKHRSGFTFLEVLLAIGMIIMLFTGIFMFYRHSVIARGRAQRAAQESQLARAVLGQMTQDMRNGSSLPAIISRIRSRGGMRVIGMPSGAEQDTPPPATSGLNGTAHSISFQTSRCVPLAHFVPARVGGFGEEVAVLPPASDLLQVQWWWSYDGQTNSSGGLYRSRRPVALPPPREGSAASDVELDPNAIMDLDAGEEPPAEPEPPVSHVIDISTDESDPLLVSECVSPEVQWAYFRYFDGELWVTMYDESELGAPPVAVEITIGFEPLLTDEQFEAGETVAQRLEELFAVDSTEPLPSRTYQTVVYLRPLPAAAAGGGMIIQGRP